MMTQRDLVSTAMTTTSGSGQFQIELDVAHARMALTGELDLSTVPVLREAAAVLLSETAQEITIDLGGLQFIDAAGLGEIVCLRATLIAAGRQLTLRRPSSRICRTFALSGLAELLPESSFGTGRQGGAPPATEWGHRT
jgi:anti-sigma B factor antagonist